MRKYAARSIQDLVAGQNIIWDGNICTVVKVEIKEDKCALYTKGNGPAIIPLNTDIFVRIQIAAPAFSLTYSPFREIMSL